MSSNFLEVSEQSPFEIAKSNNKPVTTQSSTKPVISKVEPSQVLDRAKMFLAFAQANPAANAVNLEEENADEEDGQVITLDLGMAPENAIPQELYRAQ
jgi:hypothetical protein